MKSNIFDVKLYEEWLRENSQLSESTIYLYRNFVGYFLKRNPDLDNINDYNKYLIELTVKKRSTAVFSIIKSFITFKFEDVTKREQMIKELIRPKFRNDLLRERKHLSEDTIIDVINHLETQKHRIIGLIQTLTGVRAGDVLRLKKGGIMIEEYNKKMVLRLNILGKRKKRNVMFIHDEIAQSLILDFINNNSFHPNYYFIEMGKMKHREGQYNNERALIAMNYLWYWIDLKQALQICAINKNDFATHDFRRCFARRVWEKYRDIHVLQSLLNHNDPKVTMKYLDQSGLKNIDYLNELQS